MSNEEFTQEETVADIPGVCYWGCESTLHKLCIEADQRPKIRAWNEVLEYIAANPEAAAKMAILSEGDICLTPLAVICQEGPLDVIKALVELAPEAVCIPDKYGCLPIHRTALQNRNDSGIDILSFLKSKKVSSLMVKDGWGRTPLICALESGRGPLKAEAVAILATDGAMEVESKKGLLPLDIVMSGKASKVLDEEKARLLDILQAKQ